MRFIEDYATGLGRLVDGWWFDGCYPWPVFPSSNLDFAAYIRAARAGNPEAICAFNDGAFCVGRVAPVTPLEDYHAGEVHVLVNGDIGLGWWKENPRPYMLHGEIHRRGAMALSSAGGFDVLRAGTAGPALQR